MICLSKEQSNELVNKIIHFIESEKLQSFTKYMIDYWGTIGDEYQASSKSVSLMIRKGRHNTSNVEVCVRTVHSGDVQVMVEYKDVCDRLIILDKMLLEKEIVSQNHAFDSICNILDSEEDV